MKEYEVNEDTIAIIGIDNNVSKVLERKNEYIINQNSYEVMDYSCKYFGSSYSGRVEGSKKILNANYKLPIIVEETSNLIFFPLSSPEKINCIWINLNWYQDVIEKNKKIFILLKNGKKIECFSSKYSIKNQMLRASRLSILLNDRKFNKIN